MKLLVWKRGLLFVKICLNVGDYQGINEWHGFSFLDKANKESDTLCNYSGTFSIWRDSEEKNVLILSDTNGAFLKRKDVLRYLARFYSVITQTREVFGSEDLFYIQDYEDFDPTKFLDLIYRATQRNKIRSALEIIPFEKQRRICKNPQQGFDKFKGLSFCSSLESAMKDLGIIEE